MNTKAETAFDAVQEAHKIAFAPFVFQATVSLKKLGIFSYIFENRKRGGVSISQIGDALELDTYGVGVLLEIAESSYIVAQEEGNYRLTKTGYFLNYHETTRVNLNFTNDVCYKGLFHLPEAIKNGTPEGLQELGKWSTIYEGLSQLPKDIQTSWFEFDHHYSDPIFDEALEKLFTYNPSTIYDIGGNTGKFAMNCLAKDPKVKMRILDLPGQLKKAIANITAKGFSDRVIGQEVDWLSKEPKKLPKGADVIWMCQFLDCFSEAEISSIISTAVYAMDTETRLVIIETYTDRQKFENARFALEATSLYFTVMANGNSKMYPSTVLKQIINEAGLFIDEDVALGEYHTMFVCKKK